jgi:hypothetical protein
MTVTTDAVLFDFSRPYWLVRLSDKGRPRRGVSRSFVRASGGDGRNDLVLGEAGCAHDYVVSR